jgi:hypothetical protein
MERVGPMESVHLLAGPNNSGKSNVMRVAAGAIPALASSQAFVLNEEDNPLSDGGENEPLRIAILKGANEDQLSEIAGQIRDPGILRQFLKGPTFGDHTDGIWFEFQASGDARVGRLARGRLRIYLTGLAVGRISSATFPHR